MKNNKVLVIRLTEKLNSLLGEASEGVGINKSELVRYLLTKSIYEIKKDSIKAGGYDKLVITLKKI